MGSTNNEDMAKQDKVVLRLNTSYSCVGMELGPHPGTLLVLLIGLNLSRDVLAIG